MVAVSGSIVVAWSHAADVGGGEVSAEVANGIAGLEEQIAARETRATELTNDMLALDRRVERRVGSILKTLERSSDSRETRNKVAELKRQAMHALRKCTKHYAAHRDAVSEEIKKDEPRVTREVLFDDLGKFDERLQKRVDQVIGVTSSLQQPEDYERWSYKYDSGLGATGDDDSPSDPNFYRNRRIAKTTGKLREQLKKELRASIARLHRENKELIGQMAGDITPELKGALEREVAANQDRIDASEADFAGVVVPEQSGAAPVGRKRGDVIEELVREMAEDLERDCDSIFRLYRELNQERKALKILQEQVEMERSRSK